MKIKYICFEVSSICNMDCKFCFANWRENRKQLPLEKVLEIIDKLKEYGVEAINLTGGDPLLRKDITKICKHCKELDIMPIISTTGIELLKDKEVLNYIDSINLPLDSFEQEIHNKMRPCSIKNHHGLVLELIEYIRKNYPNIKIKINTMVSKLNKDEVINIGKLIEGKVYSWKLGKFFSSGYGKNFEDMFEISVEDFEKVVKNCKEKYEKINIVDQEFIPEEDEIYNIFIDCYGRVNVHTDAGIKSYENIVDLEKMGVKKNVDKVCNLKKEYLEKVYK